MPVFMDHNMSSIPILEVDIWFVGIAKKNFRDTPNDSEKGVSDLRERDLIL